MRLTSSASGPAAAGFEALLIEAMADEAGYGVQVMTRLSSLPWAVKQLRKLSSPLPVAFRQLLLLC